MGLAAIIGTGQVGEYVAARIGEAVPGTSLVGLSATRKWLSLATPGAEFVSAFQFGKCVHALERLGATDVLFTGDPFSSIRLLQIDSTARSYVLAQGPTFWIPHAFLRAIASCLADHNIKLRGVLEYLPELGVHEIERRDHLSYAPRQDFQAAIDHVKWQHWKCVRQAFVVDQGRVLMSETSGTKQLIEKFGRSQQRRAASYPVLCKVAVPPFELIDAPTIGLDTVHQCVENGLRAIVVEARKTIVMQRDDVLQLANSDQIALYALNRDTGILQRHP